MLDERKHSRFGASAAKRYLACKASAALCEKTPPLPPTSEQREGTAAHKLIELCINYGHEPSDFVNRFVGKVEVTPDMAEAVGPFVERARGYVAAGAKTYVEHAFALVDFDAELWGTCDLIAYFPDAKLLKVEDFKYGAGVWVPAHDNPQLKMYGLGAMLSIGMPVQSLELTIDQPRCDRTAETVRTWQTDPVTLLEFGAELLRAVEIGRCEGAPYSPGDHCQFCHARGVCPALHDAALRAAGADLEPNTGSFLPPIAPELMSLEELGRRLDQADIIRTWLNGVRAFANAEMLRGRIAAGRKAVEKEGRRRWKDPALVAAQAPRVFDDLKEDQMFKPATVISPAQFEKLVGKVDAREFCREYSERPKRVALVKIDEPGEPIAIGALSDFADIVEPDNE